MQKFDLTNETLIWSIDPMSSHKSSDIVINMKTISTVVNGR